MGHRTVATYLVKVVLREFDSEEGSEVEAPTNHEIETVVEEAISAEFDTFEAKATSERTDK